MHAYNNQISYQENPIDGEDSVFYWWIKGDYIFIYNFFSNIKLYSLEKNHYK
jgi:hypothetical protein